jgi:hypothetical protein
MRSTGPPQRGWGYWETGVITDAVVPGARWRTAAPAEAFVRRPIITPSSRTEAYSSQENIAGRPRCIPNDQGGCRPAPLPSKF